MGFRGGLLALRRTGIKVKRYYASEIKDIAIKCSKYNNPDVIQIGDVHNVSYVNKILKTEKGNFAESHIDLVLFGSPCQSFSIAAPKRTRIGLKDLKKSGLFYECSRVLQEINPTYFLMENVSNMKDSDKDIITSFLGVEPIKIDSKLVSAALRNRYYWTNIQGIIQPEDKGIEFQSILDSGYTNRKKARVVTRHDSKPNVIPVKMYHRYVSTGFTNLIFKNEEHYEQCVDEYKRLSEGNKITAEDLDSYSGKVFDGVRYMNQTEFERCQTLPEGYTKCLSRNDAVNCIGDGFTIDTVAHIFSFLKEN